MTVIAPGQRLPLFRLPLAEGGDLRLSIYRGRANLALFLLPGDDEAAVGVCLAAVAEHLSAYRERHAQPLVVIEAPLATVARLAAEHMAPFPLAADAEGGVRARFLDPAAGAEPVVALTDRYAEARAVLTGWAAVGATGQADLLDILLRIDYLCSV